MTGAADGAATAVWYWPWTAKWPLFCVILKKFGNFRGILRRSCWQSHNYGLFTITMSFAISSPDEFLLANVNVLRYVCYMLWAVRVSSVCLWRWCTLLRRLNFSAIFLSPYDSPGTLLFRCQKSLVGDVPFPLKFAFKVTHPLSNSEISTNIGS